MKICQKHWDALRKAIEDRGLDGLGAKSGAEAVAAVVTELEGRGDENEFDPLMACNNMIWSNALKVCGLGIMGTKPDGGDYCPICEVLRLTEEQWINGPSDACLKLAKEKGLVL